MGLEKQQKRMRGATRAHSWEAIRRGTEVQYQYQGADIGIVLLVVKNHLYPIPPQYQNSALKGALRNKEITENIK